MSSRSLYRKNPLAKLGLMLVLFLVRAVCLNAQTGDAGAQGAPDDAGQAQNGDSQSGAVPAATGLDMTTELSENPPLTGLDEPKFERAVIEHSYVVPRAELSQSVDSNFPGFLTGNNVSAVTRAVGSVDLQKLWKVHPFDLNYTGGLAAFQNGRNSQVFLLQTLSATQRFLWRTGQLALRDSFTYLPEGTFGYGAFGGAGGFSVGAGAGGLGGGGGSGGLVGGLGSPGFTSTLFGSVGVQPRIANMANVDVTQYLTPRSSIVLAAGYGVTDFLGKPEASSLCGLGLCYLNSNQTVAQAGYNYQFSHRDQIAVSYAYQEFHFPGITAGSIKADVWQVLYGHRISGKLDFRVGGGPELVNTHEIELFTLLPGVIVPLEVGGKFLTASAQVQLAYRISPRTRFSVGYLHFVNAGSGIFGGANTNAVHFGLNHTLNRTWNMLLTTGYSRNSRLLMANATVAGNATTYHFGYVSGALRRQLGRELGLFISYQYSNFAFGSGYCATARCPNSYGRQVALIGIDWKPRPLRLD
ncbi:MAG: hypothetical protein J2P13_03405 [Acidobacteria bacterium]|nr:hypothetical protein [Acidobacteriota bacterium]